MKFEKLEVNIQEKILVALMEYFHYQCDNQKKCAKSDADSRDWNFKELPFNKKCIDGMKKDGLYFRVFI